MKKILIAGVVSTLFSAGAFAAACAGGGGAQQAGSATAPAVGEQCVCNGGNAIKSTINGGSGTVIETPLFIKNGFDVQCSQNTIVSYNEVSTNAFAVGAGSIKGNQSVNGSTAGGAVAVFQKCTGTNDACTPGNITAATADAAAKAGGS